jgi:hypothetical protein
MVVKTQSISHMFKTARIVPRASFNDSCAWPCAQTRQKQAVSMSLRQTVLGLFAMATYLATIMLLSPAPWGAMITDADENMDRTSTCNINIDNDDDY